MKTSKKFKIEPTKICYHPNLRPTEWNQSKPAPCEMIRLCECGANQSCPVCGWGHGAYPCDCTIQAIEDHMRQYGDVFKELAEDVNPYDLSDKRNGNWNLSMKKSMPEI